MTKITFHNAETGEVIEREMNAQELEQYKKDMAEFIAKKQEFEARAAEKAALLAKLGITNDEAKLLLS